MKRVAVVSSTNSKFGDSKSLYCSISLSDALRLSSTANGDVAGPNGGGKHESNIFADARSEGWGGHVPIGLSPHAAKIIKAIRQSIGGLMSAALRAVFAQSASSSLSTCIEVNGRGQKRNSQNRSPATAASEGAS